MPETHQDDVTDLLIAWSAGDRQVQDQLVRKVYDRLHRLAGSFLNRERREHTLQTTALVNEAFIQLVRQDRAGWRDRAHFFAIAGRIMRRILVDHARRRQLEKHGGEAKKIPFEDLERLPAVRSAELVALDDALNALHAEDPRASKIVELRYFGGLTKEEIAEVLGISRATVTRSWQMARSWLYCYLTEDVVVEP